MKYYSLFYGLCIACSLTIIGCLPPAGGETEKEPVLVSCGKVETITYDLVCSNKSEEDLKLEYIDVAQKALQCKPECNAVYTATLKVTDKDCIINIEQDTRGIEYSVTVTIDCKAKTD